MYMYSKISEYIIVISHAKQSSVVNRSQMLVLNCLTWMLSVQSKILEISDWKKILIFFGLPHWRKKKNTHDVYLFRSFVSPRNLPVETYTEVVPSLTSVIVFDYIFIKTLKNSQKTIMLQRQQQMINVIEKPKHIRVKSREMAFQCPTYFVIFTRIIFLNFTL